WIISSGRGAGKPVDKEVAKSILDIMDNSIRNARIIGDISEEGIRILMEETKRSSDLGLMNLQLPIGAGSEHLFAWNLELVTRKHLVHGEIVSLGIVIASYLQSQHMSDSRYAELRKALLEARVIHHPDEIGVAWEEIEEALKTVGDYNRR